LWVALASVPVGLLSWMDMLITVICCSMPILPHWGGVTIGRSRPSSTLHQVHRHDRRMLQNAPQFLLPSLAPLFTNTPGALGHLVTHTWLATRDIQKSLFHQGSTLGQNGCCQASVLGCL